jgi:hypothetical protein
MKLTLFPGPVSDMLFQFFFMEIERFSFFFMEIGRFNNFSWKLEDLIIFHGNWKI